MSCGRGQRFYIRYSIQRWRDSRFFLTGLVIILLVLLGTALLRQQPISPAWLVLLVVEVAFLGGLYLFSRTSYLELTPERLKIRYLLTRIEVPYSAVARVRKQPLGVAFQVKERRRYVNGLVRRLAPVPAVYLRIDRNQPDLLARLERQLGPRVVVGTDVVLPITDADRFTDAVRSRLRGSA